MQPKFSSDEKVLCYHGPLLYEAKILKNKKDGGSYTYFVHYQGWNRNWDEWVAETRIMKQVAENFDKQKKLLATHMAQTKAKKQKQKAEKAVKKGKGGSDSGSNSRASTPVSDKPPTERRAGKRNLADDEMSTSSKDDEVSNPPFTTKETRKKNRKEETVEDTVENILSGEIEKKNVFILYYFPLDDKIDNKYCIDIPEELKYVLVNDWDLVVHQKQLFKLPAKVSVNNIIEQYLNHLKRQEMTPGKKSIAMEVIRGIGQYFDVSLGPQLLYNMEKLQYKDVSQQIHVLIFLDVEC